MSSGSPCDILCNCTSRPPLPRQGASPKHYGHRGLLLINPAAGSVLPEFRELHLGMLAVECGNAGIKSDASNCERWFLSVGRCGVTLMYSHWDRAKIPKLDPHAPRRD